jgi:hypothetical protein
MEYDKEQLEQQWQERLAREQQYISFLIDLKQAKEKKFTDIYQRRNEGYDMEILQCELSIEIFDLDTNIKTKEYYIESMKSDKAQQQAFQDAKMQFIENHSTDILKKARVCIERGTDRATVLEGLTKDMPQRETPKWYARIWEINEHVNAAKVPTT